MTTRRLVALVLVVVALASGCAVRVDSSPRDIPADDRTLEQADVGEGDDTGDSRIYLLSPGETGQQRQLRSARRDVPATADVLLGALFAGPTQSELDGRIGTAIPTTVELLSTRPVGGVLVVDVSEGLGDLTGNALLLAVAQIVYTASEVDGVDAVRLTVNGIAEAWPTGDGQTSTTALSVFDYPGVAESAQPAFPAVPVAG
ncbi:MAG: GerMN domain-containing protein [Ilumatobacteraceae bacterium]|jgi:spore germination protein GerM|nr:GerMN domain-containing protein [Ilumatobacteraceae bacterium]